MKKGDRVICPKFGKGVVKDVQESVIRGMAGTTAVRVAFDDFGTITVWAHALTICEE